MTPRTALTALVAGLLAVVTAAPAQAADTWTAQLSGSQEVPAQPSPGRGSAVFQLSADGTAISHRLVVANIDNVVAAHIHLAPAGVNGPVVAFLFGPAAPGGGTSNGVIATGTITAANLVGPLAGQPLQSLVDAIDAGNAYVNVHTNDGNPSTPPGPGDLPGGEIRGQLH